MNNRCQKRAGGEGSTKMEIGGVEVQHLLQIGGAASHDEVDLDGVEGEADGYHSETRRHPKEGLALTALGGSKAWYVKIIWQMCTSAEILVWYTRD